MAKRKVLGWDDVVAQDATGSSREEAWAKAPDLGYQATMPEPAPEPEAPVKAPKRSWGDVAGDTAITAAKGAIGLPEAAVGLADVVTGGNLQIGKHLEDIGYRPREAKEFLNEQLSGAQKAANAKVNKADGFVDTLSALKENPSVALTTIGESLPQMIGGTGIARGILGLAPKVGGAIAAAVGEGALGAGSAAEGFRSKAEDKELSPKMAAIAAASGVGTGVFGFVGSKLAARFGLGDIDTIMATGMGQATTKGFAKQLIGSGISEGAFEEMPQSIQETMWSNYEAGKPITDGIGNAAAQGLVAGMAMGGAGGGYNAMLNKPYESQLQLEAHRSTVAALGQQVHSAYQAYQFDPTDPKKEEAFASAYTAYTAAVTTRPQRDDAANAAASQSAAQILGATSVDEATEIFNKANEASSILRTGAEVAETAAKNRAAANTNATTTSAAAATIAPTPATTPAIAPAPAVAPAPVASTLPAEIEAQGVIEPGEEVIEQVIPAAATTAPPAAPSTPAPTTPTLPEYLAQANPTYSFGARKFTPQFPNDVMRAAYIAAGTKPSKADAEYVAFVQQHTGMSEQEVRQYGAHIRDMIKAEAKTAPAGSPIALGNIPYAPPAQAAATTAPATSEIKHADLIRTAADTVDGRMTIGKDVREILTTDFSQGLPSNKLIDKLRNLNYIKEVPPAIALRGVTQQQWDEYRDSLKEASKIARTKGVAAEIDKGTTVGGMLDYLATNAHPRVAKLATKLMALSTGNPYLALKYSRLPASGRARGGVTSNYAGNIIAVGNMRGKGDEITSLHEPVHVLTLSWLDTADKNSALYKELTGMLKTAKTHADKLGVEHYGLGNEAEFLAEAFANPEFQDFLMSVPATKNQSIWEKMVSWVRDVIGDPSIDLQMLGQAMAVTEKAIKLSTKKAKGLEGGLAPTVKRTKSKTSRDEGGFDDEGDYADMEEVATRDVLTALVDEVFDKTPDQIDKLIDMNEKLGAKSLEELQAMRPGGMSKRFIDAYITRIEAGYDDAFDVINDHLDALDEMGMVTSMNEALGLEIEDVDFAPDPGGEGMDEYAGLGQTIPIEEEKLRSALDQLWLSGGNNIATIQRTLQQSPAELNLIARTAGNGARSNLAQAMLEYDNLEDARAAAESYFADLMNGDIEVAAASDKFSKQSDPAPATAPGGRNTTFDFKQRLATAFRNGTLDKLASFWQNVMQNDGQIDIKVDAKKILNGTSSTDADYAKLRDAYNEAIFAKAKAWAAEHNHPEPHDKPSNYLIGHIKSGRNEMSKPIIQITLRGRGREHAGENPYLPSTTDLAPAEMDFNPASKKNEIHTMDLDGYNGTSDLAYRIFSELADAHNLSLPTSDTLMSNNNARRPWQTVAASLRTGNPDLLSPINQNGVSSAYGMDTELWPHLNERQRVGANILRHVHNALVGRPDNKGRYSKTVVSNGRALDNLVVNPNGDGFIAKFEPNTPNGVAKGTKLSFEDFARLLKKSNAIGGTDMDVDAGRKGLGPTSAAFAVMSQTVLDEIENNPYADPTAEAVTTATKAGANQSGWFFDTTPEQKSQLASEIEAVREFLSDPNNSAEEKAQAREVLRQLTASDIDLKIEGLTAEHRSAQTSNGRRGEINREIAALRTEQSAKRETMLENIGISAEAKYDAERAENAPVLPIRIQGEHYSHQPRTELLGDKYGTGYKGAERIRIEQSNDPRLKDRVYFYANAGNGIKPESGVGAIPHVANLSGIYPAHESQSIQKTVPNTLTGDAWTNAFESAVLDAGYSGYSSNFGNQLAVVVFGKDPIPVTQGRANEEATKKNEFADDPKATLVNIGLDVGAEDRIKKINPATAKMMLENAGVKVGRSNVIESKYMHNGQEVVERTLVAELDRPLTKEEADKVAKLLEQQAIAQRTSGGNALYGPMAEEWGGFDPAQFALLDGTKMDTGIISNADGTPLSLAADAAVQGALVAPAGPNEIRILDPRASTWFQRILAAVRVALQDKHVTLGRIMRAVKDETVLSVIDRFQGVRQNAYERMVAEPMADLENELNRQGITRAQFDEFLKMRAVQDRNNHVARVNPFNPDTGKGFNTTNKPGTGIETADALAYLAGLDMTKYAEAGRMYNAITRSLQDYAVQSGLEKQDTIDAWNNLFPNYAPLFRDLDLEDTGSGTGFGFSTREGIARRAMGSEAAITSPLANTILQGGRIVDRGEKARVGQTMLNLARKSIPMYRTAGGEWKPMWKVDTFPNIRAIKRVNVYQFKDANGNLVLNAGGVPTEFYSAAKAEAYLVTNTNQQGGPKVVVSQGVQERVVTAQNPAYINRDNVMVIPVDGQNHALVFDEQSVDAMEMVKNLKNMDAAQLTGLFKVTNVFSRWVVGTSTQYNPMFAPINFLRDIQSSAINMASTDVPNWKAADSLALMGNAAKNSVSIFKYLQAKHAAKHSNALASAVVAQRDTPEWWMEQAAAAGGLTGIRDMMHTFEDAMRNVSNLFGDMHTPTTDPRINQDRLFQMGERAEKLRDLTSQFLEGDVKNKAAKLASKVPVMVDHLNSAFEMGTRVAAFKSAYEKYVTSGLSHEDATKKAAVISKNISVNFNRKGNFSSQMGALFPFFNAAVQGGARLAELLFEKKAGVGAEGAYTETTQLSKVGKRIAAALPALGAAQALILAAAGYDDEQPPEHVKARNFVIPTGDGTYVTLPMPLGLNALFNAGRHGMEAVLHPENFGNHVMDAIMDIPQAFNPLGGTPNALLNWTPAVGDVPVALLQNKDAFGRPIYREDRDPRRPTPGYTRHKEGTSDTGIWIAKALNDLTGGNEYRPGLINWTGDQIDYVFGQTTGGIGREVGKAGQFAFGAETSEERPWYKVPLAGKFVGDLKETSAVRNQLYSVSAELNTLNAEVEGLREDRRFDEAKVFAAEHPELAARGKVEAYFNQEGKLRKARSAARAEGDLDKAKAIDTELREKSAKLLAEIKRAKGED